MPSKPFFLRYARAVASLPDHLKPVPVRRERLPREVMAEHQRARALEAVIDLLAKQGYPATTVDDLVAAARIGVGSFYSHFGGKEECLIAAYDLIVGEAEATISRVMDQGSSWVDRVCLGVRSLLAWAAAEPSRGRIALVEIQTGGPEAMAHYLRNLDAAAGLLRTGRKVMRPARSLPDSLEQTIVSGIAWLLHRHLVTGEESSMPSLFDELTELILEPYFGQEGAKEEIAKSRLATNAWAGPQTL